MSNIVIVISDVDFTWEYQLNNINNFKNLLGCKISLPWNLKNRFLYSKCSNFLFLIYFSGFLNVSEKL